MGPELIKKSALPTLYSSPRTYGAVRNMTAIMNETLLNHDVIMINQDYTVLPGKPATLCDGKTQAWVRLLSDGTIAVAVPNLGSATATLTICFADLSITSGHANVRDVWAKKDLGKLSTSVSASVEVHDTFLVIVTPESLI
jgi:alpha-galactosidase